MSRTLRVFGATALSLALLSPVAAHGDRWGDSDPAGDVEGSSWSPDPAPCGTDTPVDSTAVTNNDITHFAVRHTRRIVVITTRFRGLDRNLEQHVAMHVRTNLGGWWLDVDRFEDGPGKWRIFSFLAKEPDLPDPEELPDDACGIGVAVVGEGCRMERTLDFKRDLVRLAVPRKCLDNPRWVRGAVGAYGWVESDDPSSTETIHWDSWDDGVELSPWAPSFGPRVRATRPDTLPAPTSTREPAGVELRVFVRPGGIFRRR
ncbi:hypothetical protein DJ010_16790 [Nocardioides silvaticus]|uniref:Uncharacterized protein n=1 Tax=Nocardioides silvaticus TaxID=2201891 RepID=A0A316TBL2_9ACTN|nr:hypothetical protein [Nocardioides silvaticus]PWN01697.1 hypothetical protein DJ010_16790 [Nocardioides silvaticus]